jgi:hypothetical protein
VHRPAWPHRRSHHRSGRRASGMRPTIDSIQRCDPRPILGRSLLDKMAACGWVMRAREAMGGLLARVVATTDHTRPRARTASLSLPSAADRVSVAAGQCNLPQRSMRFLKHHPRSPQTVVLGPEATWGYLRLRRLPYDHHVKIRVPACLLDRARVDEQRPRERCRGRGAECYLLRTSLPSPRRRPSRMQCSHRARQPASDR